MAHDPGFYFGSGRSTDASLLIGPHVKPIGYYVQAITRRSGHLDLVLRYGHPGDQGMPDKDHFAM